MNTIKPMKASKADEKGLDTVMEMFRSRLLRKAYRPGVREEIPADVVQCERDFSAIVYHAIEERTVNRQQWSEICDAFSDRWPHVSHWLHPSRLADILSSQLGIKFEGKRPTPASKDTRVNKPTIRAKKYYCAECDVVCNSLGQYDIHEKGKKHQEHLTTISEAAALQGKCYSSPSPLPCDGAPGDAYYIQLGEHEEKKNTRAKGAKKGNSTAARLLALASLAVSATIAPENDPSAIPVSEYGYGYTYWNEGDDEQQDEEEQEDADKRMLPQVSFHMPAVTSQSMSIALMEPEMQIESVVIDDNASASTVDADSIASVEEDDDCFTDPHLSKFEETELLYPLENALVHNQPVPLAFTEADRRIAAVAWMGASITTVLPEEAVKRGAELACSAQTPDGMEQELGKMVMNKLKHGPGLIECDMDAYDQDTEAEEWADEQNAKAWVRYAQTFAMSVHLVVQSAMPTESLLSTIPSFFRHVTEKGSQLPKAAQNHILTAVNAIETSVSALCKTEPKPELSASLSYFSQLQSGLHKSIRNALNKASFACRTGSSESQQQLESALAEAK
eukprot:TRINITY_DN10424_c0_g1_i1.p1 TRINITY_DN10424_c0_g1~~TRINITY_DN10424_c0_g1_i1.p1  ORF type:complete len:563 (+),score=130.91 TRINITY_DN10424_c0_g1_i1:47-1735(+)